MIKQLDTLSQMAEMIYEYTDLSISSLLLELDRKTFSNTLQRFQKTMNKIYGNMEADYHLEYSLPQATLFTLYIPNWSIISRYVDESYICKYYGQHLKWRPSFFYRSWSWSRTIIMTENSITFICNESNCSYIEDLEQDTTFTYEFNVDEQYQLFF